MSKPDPKVIAKIVTDSVTAVTEKISEEGVPSYAATVEAAGGSYNLMVYIDSFRKYPDTKHGRWKKQAIQAQTKKLGEMLNLEPNLANCLAVSVQIAHISTIRSQIDFAKGGIVSGPVEVVESFNKFERL